MTQTQQSVDNNWVNYAEREDREKKPYVEPDVNQQLQVLEVIQRT